MAEQVPSASDWLCSKSLHGKGKVPMEIVCDFRSIRKMAHAVGETANLMEGRQFWPLPWNRFAPENTDWWLVPSADKRAHRYGKAMFTSSDRFPDRVVCCLNVEKGFGSIAAEVYPELRARGFILDQDWAWFRFLDGLADGRVAGAAQMIVEEAGSPVTLAISASYTGSPLDFEPYAVLDPEAIAAECRSPLDAGRIWFDIRNGALEKVEERCIGDLLRPVAKCRQVRDLPAALQSSKEFAWAWVDVYAGTVVSLAEEGKSAANRWNDADIWRKLLRPWLPWIV
jgi:hypothetical protein